MSLRTSYRAPWGRELIALSGVGLLTFTLPAAFAFRRGGVVVATLLTALAIGLISTTVRGYDIVAGQLVIRRLFWVTRWPLASPTKAMVRPRAMDRSWRIWGNGGFFVFSGRFSNAALGRYHAFVTDLDRTVVLETPKGVLVVSPDDPAQFTSSVGEMTARPPKRAN